VKIFLLEDDPLVFGPVINYFSYKKHIIEHAEYLVGAAFLLEHDPGVSSFDLFLFDVALPREEVSYLNKNKGIVPYSHPKDFNGLLFILHNLDILGDKIDRVALLTAHKQQVMNLENINVFGKVFTCKPLPPEDDQVRADQEQVTKIRYLAEGTNDKYTLSFIDKCSNTVISLINKFINRG